MYKKIFIPLFVLCVIAVLGFLLIDREEHSIPFITIQTWDSIISIPDTPAWSTIYPLTSQSYISLTGYTRDGDYLKATIKPGNWTLIIRDMDVVWWFTSLDISSLTVSDNSPAYWDGANDYLRQVLFSVDEYPNIRFIHKAHTWTNYVIGDLTITDVTHQVLFPMNFSFTWNMLVWDAYFVIDRYQRWLDGLDDYLDSYLEISLHFVWERITN